MNLFSDQIQAVEMSKKNSVCIITGAPGTGKTTVLKAILDHHEEKKLSTLLGAPSGKAAKRLLECTGRKAFTIHKLLDPQKSGDKFVFTRNSENPIETDLIAIDEMSMVDTWLMARLLSAITPGTRLFLIGDVYQLPSVGPGNILKDLIASRKIPYVELTKIKRQDAGLIIRNCHAIKNGKDINVKNATSSDFFFLERDSEKDIADTIFDLVSKRLPKTYHADPLKDIQIIAPLREKTFLSCKSLNSIFQKKINPNPKIDGCRFKVGDKIIQTKNQYELGIVNGDIGFVLDIDKRNRLITVVFENPERTVDIALYENELELAYSITIHKFQGSEAPVIVMPIHPSFGPLIMQRNLLYTAISRARKVCVLVGHRKEIPLIIRRNQQQRRHTGLREMLR